MLSFQHVSLVQGDPGIEQGWNKDGNSCVAAKGQHPPRGKSKHFEGDEHDT